MIKVPKHVARGWAVAPTGTKVGEMIERFDGDVMIVDVVGEKKWTSLTSRSVMDAETWLLLGRRAVSAQGIMMLKPWLAPPVPRGKSVVRSSGALTARAEKRAKVDVQVGVGSGDLQTETERMKKRHKGDAKPAVTDAQVDDIFDAVVTVFEANDNKPMNVSSVFEKLKLNIETVPSQSVLIACLRKYCVPYGTRWQLM